jgi:hypothetical protein
MKSKENEAEVRLRQFAQRVAHLRRSPAASREALEAVRQFQRERLATGYADLLSSERYRPAARFFLDELYGTKDFTARDEELARMIPSMSRLLPTSVLAPLADAIELDAVSEELDQAMASVHEGGLAEEPVVEGTTAAGAPGTARLPALTEARYFDVYRAVGRRALRVRQIELIEQVGRELDRLVNKPFLYRILKGMEGPARLAGLARMQSFLVSGFDAFRTMRGATEFIRIVTERERALMETTFAQPAASTTASTPTASSNPAATDPAATDPASTSPASTNTAPPITAPVAAPAMTASPTTASPSPEPFRTPPSGRAPQK